MKPILDRTIVAEGKIIFEEGDEGNYAYIIESGEVEISKIVNGEWKILAIKKQNELFGELALIDSKPRMAMARAKTALTVIRITRPVFEKKLENADRFLRALLKILVDNARTSGYRQTAGFKEANN